MGSFKEARAPELRRMMAILYPHAERIGVGPWLVGRFREIAEGNGPLSSGDEGFVNYYLKHFLGMPVEMCLDDKGRVVEMQGPKLTLRQPSSGSGRWKPVKDEETNK